MRKFSTFFWTAVLTLCFTALSTQTKAQNVYVGGIHNARAVVWKNGTPTYLTAGEGEVNSVVVANGHVYAAGIECVSETSVAKVWKDGVELYLLGSNPVSARSIAVSGTDVYVAGHVNFRGKLWKNGVAQSGYTEAILLGSVFVDGDSVYATGCTTAHEVAV